MLGQGSPPGITTWRGFALLRAQDLYMWMSRQDDTDTSALRGNEDKRRFLPDLPVNANARPRLVRW